MSGGIYKIVNLVNQKFYIGSAVNFKIRWKDHLKLLRRNKHKNKYVQNAYNKYGEENFKFEIVECCEKQKLPEREQFYLDTTDCCNKEIGYNLYAVAGSPLGTKWSDEQRRKFLESNKNFKHTDECKERMKAYQSTRPQAHNENISKGKMGHFVAEETKAKIGKANSKPDKWPHELGYNCKCEECRAKKNKIMRERRGNFSNPITFTMVDINV